VGGTTTEQGQRPGAAGRWPKLASPGAAAAGLGGLGLALLAAWVLLTALTRDVQVSRDGAAVVFAVGTGLLGLLLARRQPQNPEGWLLLGPAAAVLAVLDGGLYAVLDYGCTTAGCRWARPPYSSGAASDRRCSSSSRSSSCSFLTGA